MSLDEGTSPAPDRGFGTAAAILVAGFVASRLAGLGRDVAISAIFGTRPELDAYFAAFRLPDLVFQLLAGAALGSAFMPTFAGLLHQGDHARAWFLASSTLNLTFVGTLAASLLLALVAPLVVPVYVPGFSGDQQALTVRLVRVMLLSPVFFSSSGIVMAILNAHRHFSLPALAPVVYNVVIAAAALALGWQLGVFALAIGVVSGAALHLLVQLPGLARLGMAYHAVVRWEDPALRDVGRLALPRVAGLAAVQLNFVVVAALASMLQPGSLAALNYAWAITMMPMGIFGVALGTALFPTLVDLAARREEEALRRAVAAGLRLVLFLTVPTTLGLILLRRPAVALLFQRGLFQRSSTEATAFALAFYAVGLPGHAALEILSRSFYALKDTVTPVRWLIGAMALTIGLGLALVGPLRHGGLALALSTATLIEAVGLAVVLRSRLPGLKATDFAAFAVRLGISSALMAAVVAGLLRWSPFEADTFAGLLALVVVATTAGGVVYWGSALVLGSEEAWLPLRRRLL